MVVFLPVGEGVCVCFFPGQSKDLNFRDTQNMLQLLHIDYVDMLIFLHTRYCFFETSGDF